MKTILKLNKMEIYLFIAIIGATIYAIGAMGMLSHLHKGMSSEKNIPMEEHPAGQGIENGSGGKRQ